MRKGFSPNTMAFAVVKSMRRMLSRMRRPRRCRAHGHLGEGGEGEGF